MKWPIRRLLEAASLAGVYALVLFFAAPARAQGADPRPQWMKDSVFIFNRYVGIWEYWTSGNVTKFEIWGMDGDPEDQFDDFAFFLDPKDPTKYGIPWGNSRLFGAPHPPYGIQNPDQTPYCNEVTFRFDDPGNPNAVKDVAFPGGGTQMIAPPVVELPKDQGWYAPYRFENGDLEITQKLQFARDLVRIEFVVKNVGGTARRVGLRLLLDPYIDYWGDTQHFFIPESRARPDEEIDFGFKTGTNTPPRDSHIPREWLLFEKDSAPDPHYAVKGILTGNGATTPTRFAFVNSLNLFPQGAVWDYSIDTPMKFRISDMATVLWWDPIPVPARSTTSFVTYAGVGVASHTMSNAYLRAQRTFSDETQGYIAAVQAPFAMPLRNGNADRDASGAPLVSKVTAYMQNEYHVTALPGAFAFIDLPEGLKLSGDGEQSRRLDLGDIAVIGSGFGADEGSGNWTVQATGADAGLLTMTVTFTDGFSDSVRVKREINVPQGRRYQLGDDWRMVTFPFTYAEFQDDPATALGVQPGTFQIVRYNPEIRSYERVSRIQPGESYWVRMLGIGTKFIRLKDASPVKLDQAQGQIFQVRMNRGWNQVGNPSPYLVPVRDIKFLLRGGLIITFQDAVDQGLILPVLYSYDRKKGRYQKLNINSTVPPGKGVWIYSYDERNMIWPAPEGPRVEIG